MVFEGVRRSTPWVPTHGVPDIDDVVIPPTGQKPSVRGPPETTDIHRVSLEHVLVEEGHPGVIVVDLSRLGARGEEARPAVPGQAAHTGVMASHPTYQLASIYIPQLKKGGNT